MIRETHKHPVATDILQTEEEESNVVAVSAHITVAEPFEEGASTELWTCLEIFSSNGGVYIDDIASVCHLREILEVFLKEYDALDTKGIAVPDTAYD